MAKSEDLPFIAHDGHKKKYSQFWVNTDVLNIRSGPSFTHRVISKTYLGNLVFAYAKKANGLPYVQNSLRQSMAFILDLNG